jgi:hypothetical protein
MLDVSGLCEKWLVPLAVKQERQAKADAFDAFGPVKSTVPAFWHRGLSYLASKKILYDLRYIFFLVEFNSLCSYPTNSVAAARLGRSIALVGAENPLAGAFVRL